MESYQQTTTNQQHRVLYPVYNENNILLTREDLRKILKKGGIKKDIQNLEIFQEAFVHESYCNKTDFIKYEKFFGRLTPYDESSGILPLQNKSCERLEWLGDGILQSVIANYLYKRYDDQQEGFLTILRSKLVNTDTLSRLAHYLNLDRYIIMSKHKEIEENGRTDKEILEDSFEALIGSMSIEFGAEDEVEGYKMCRKFIIKLYEDNIDFSNLILKDENYKDQLMRYFHRIYEGLTSPPYSPKYDVVKTEITENDNGSTVKKYYIAVKNYEGIVIGEGVSFNKKDAEVKAAKAGLQYYGIMDGF